MAAAPSEPEQSDLGNFLNHLRDPAKFTISIQVDPASQPDPTELDGVIAQIRSQGGVQAIDVNDRSSKVSWDPTSTAEYIQRRGLMGIPHITCREATFGHVMKQVLAAVTFSGLNAVLVITGDEPKRDTYPQCGRGVFQGNAAKLVRALDALRLGTYVPDPETGTSLVMPRVRFAIGVAFDQNAADLEAERKKLGHKLTARANFVMPQPIFTLAQAEALRDAMAGIIGDRPVMPGIWPLQSREQAIKLNEHLPGVTVPDEVIERMPPNSAGEEARVVGRQLARDLLDQIRDRRLFNGAYIVAPNRDSREALRMLNGH